MPRRQRLGLDGIERRRRDTARLERAPERILVDAFIDNVRRWRRGEALDGLVDRAAGY